MKTLGVRLDNLGDVLLTGPALRALADGSDSLSLLAGPNGAAAGALLPGIDEVLTWRCPWIDPAPDPVDPDDVEGLVSRLAERRFDRAVVFTSFHQSALPTAVLLRLAGIPWVGAVSEDYPGALLDLRHHVPDGLHEVERALHLAAACGFGLPTGDQPRLRLRALPPCLPAGLHPGEYVVLHPGTSVPARAWPAGRWEELARLLARRGVRFVVTGGPEERALTARVAGASGGAGADLGGATSLVELAGVVGGAASAVAGNTGPAHLAAAVGTPVVSLFAPTVPARRWAPYGVPVVLLGDQDAPCRDSRATRCPLPGHPCLSTVGAEEVADALDRVRDLAQPCGNRG